MNKKYKCGGKMKSYACGGKMKKYGGGGKMDKKEVGGKLYSSNPDADRMKMQYGKKKGGAYARLKDENPTLFAIVIKNAKKKKK